MAVAMFAIVTFMIAYMAIFKDVLTQNFENESVQSGGWQLVAGSPDNNYQRNPGLAFPANVAAAPTRSARRLVTRRENRSIAPIFRRRS